MFVGLVLAAWTCAVVLVYLVLVICVVCWVFCIGFTDLVFMMLYIYGYYRIVFIVLVGCGD